LADGARLFPVWADARLGSPDVYVAPLRTDFAIAVPPSVSGVPGLPLALEVDVRNDTPYDDARFTVAIDAGFPELPDTTLVVGPLGRGAEGTALYAPLVGAWINVPATRTLDIRVVSDRSAAVRDASAALVPGSVDVGLADFAAAPRAAGGMQLRWRAAPDARFHVERATAAPGPFVRLTPSPAGAVRGDRFEFVDAGVRAGERVFYRLIGLGAAGEAQVFGPWTATAAAPAAVALLGARPNPFNPTTAIRFELPRDADVTLRILDVRGREVATLLAGARRGAGEHAVLWDGRSAAGTSQASGVYVAELRALGARITQRLVLLR
jgi:hypothetical protein